MYLWRTRPVKELRFFSFFFAEKHVETIIEANWDWLVDCELCVTISVPLPLTVSHGILHWFQEDGPLLPGVQLEISSAFCRDFWGHKWSTFQTGFWLVYFLDSYCWWKTSCTSSSVVYPIIYRVLYIPGGAGCRIQPSTVVSAKSGDGTCMTYNRVLRSWRCLWCWATRGFPDRSKQSKQIFHAGIFKVRDFLLKDSCFTNMFSIYSKEKYNKMILLLSLQNIEVRLDSSLTPQMISTLWLQMVWSHSKMEHGVDLFWSSPNDW